MYTCSCCVLVHVITIVHVKLPHAPSCPTVGCRALMCGRNRVCHCNLTHPPFASVDTVVNLSLDPLLGTFDGRLPGLVSGREQESSFRRACDRLRPSVRASNTQDDQDALLPLPPLLSCTSVSSLKASCTFHPPRPQRRSLQILDLFHPSLAPPNPPTRDRRWPPSKRPIHTSSQDRRRLTNHLPLLQRPAAFKSQRPTLHGGRRWQTA